ncbi:MAG: NepR family anti-sigma factor [Hyphomicrobiaceae bacterium]|nr:NepR family anti-sigma factor [Hyphomicrobiaceae bacterium]
MFPKNEPERADTAASETLTQAGEEVPREQRRAPMLRLVLSNDVNCYDPAAAGSPMASTLHQPFHRAAMLDRAQQARIGQMLRSAFSDVAEAPVPDRFVELLEALQTKESSRDR